MALPPFVSGTLVNVNIRRTGDPSPAPPVHGSREALYAYPLEHYPVWQTLRAQAGVAPWEAELPPGALGEDLSLRGLLESQVWVGDLLQFPNCELAVSAPGFACAAFDAAAGFNQASKMMIQSGYCGFYLAVRTPGELTAGERFTLLPGPREVSIAELFRARAPRRT